MLVEGKWGNEVLQTTDHLGMKSGGNASRRADVKAAQEVHLNVCIVTHRMLIMALRLPQKNPT